VFLLDNSGVKVDLSCERLKADPRPYNLLLDWLLEQESSFSVSSSALINRRLGSFYLISRTEPRQQATMSV